jgi:hypothetical protein
MEKEALIPKTTEKPSWFDDLMNGLNSGINILTGVKNAATNVKTAVDSGAASHITDDPLTFKLSNIPDSYIFIGVGFLIILVMVIKK